MLQQLTEIATGNVVQEHDDAQTLPAFGGPWGDANLFEWKPAPKSRLVKLAFAAKKASIESAYQTALDAGVTYSGAQFQSNEKSITRLTRVLTAVANGWAIPAAFYWLDSDNNPHPANAAYLQGLAKAFADHYDALFVRLQTAKTAIKNAKTVAAVNKIVL